MPSASSSLAPAADDDNTSRTTGGGSEAQVSAMSAPNGPDVGPQRDPDADITASEKLPFASDPNTSFPTLDMSNTTRTHMPGKQPDDSSAGQGPDSSHSPSPTQERKETPAVSDAIKEPEIHAEPETHLSSVPSDSNGSPADPLVFPGTFYPAEVGQTAPTAPAALTSSPSAPILSRPDKQYNLLANDLGTPHVVVNDAPMNLSPEAVAGDAEATHNPHAAAEPSSAASTPRSDPETPVTPTDIAGLSNISGGSIVFVVKALETIRNSKEARRDENLRATSEIALGMTRDATAALSSVTSKQAPTQSLTHTPRPFAKMDAHIILEPLRLACVSKYYTLIPVSIDCIGKLMSFDFFSDPEGDVGENQPATPSLTDIVTDTVCEAITASADVQAELQAIKALLMVVVSSTNPIHHKRLLKAIRTVYDILLSSKSQANQAAAHANLTQMVHHVYSRVFQSSQEISSLSPKASFNVLGQSPSASSVELATATTVETSGTTLDAGMTAHDLCVQDAYLVLRTLCKLSEKKLTYDEEKDAKSKAVRNKVLSLHLIYVILKYHMPIFTDSNVVISLNAGKETLIHAIKPYIFLAISNNTSSSINQVLQLAMEISWLTLDNLRPFVKAELEILLSESFLALLKSRTTTATQKSILLSVLLRLCQNPQALVEIYINYDNGRAESANVYEDLINVISKISGASPASIQSTPQPLPSAALQGDELGLSALGLQSLHVDTSNELLLPIELHLKRQSLEHLTTVLHSLVQWARRNEREIATTSSYAGETTGSKSLYENDLTNHSGIPTKEEDEVLQPTAAQVELQNQSEAAIAKVSDVTRLEGIRKFNKDAHQGISFLIEEHVLSDEPTQIARFLLDTEGLSKFQIGEFLRSSGASSEGVMHVFVDQMEFQGADLLPSLWRFLQTLRLPGDTQAIDWLVLKFSQRYVACNPGAFATVDTAYLLAYASIILDTDMRNPAMRNHMTRPEFTQMVWKTAYGRSLPEDILRNVYESIVKGQTKMQDASDTATEFDSPSPSSKLSQMSDAGRNSQGAPSHLQLHYTTDKSEAILRNLALAHRRVDSSDRPNVEGSLPASLVDHIKPMFEVAWMPILAGISGPMQETQDIETVRLCLAAFHDAIHLACLLDMKLQRDAFLSTLAKFTVFSQPASIKSKQVEAIKHLLDIALNEGNHLHESWNDVLKCVLQLKRFQLINDEENEQPLPNLDQHQTSSSNLALARNIMSNTSIASFFGSGSHDRNKPTRDSVGDVVSADVRAEITEAVDKIFEQTRQISGPAVEDFVKALCAVSWQEIQSKGTSEHLKLYALQKLVDVTYNSIDRLRFDWAPLSETVCGHFNRVLKTNYFAISNFAVDSLYQLANKFLEMKELSGYTFQKSFLQPFSFGVHYSPEAEIREKIIECLLQLVRNLGGSICSGWAVILTTVFHASTDSSDKVVQKAFELMQVSYKGHLGPILQQGGHSDVPRCLTNFALSQSQHISLQAIDLLRTIIPSLPILGGQIEHNDKDTLVGPEAQNLHWFPVFSNLLEVVLLGTDIEARRVALDTLFDLVKTYAPEFTASFWDKVIHEVLFKIFNLVRGRGVPPQGDPTVWLNTTLIQALRNLMDLWTLHFKALERFLPEFVDLLELCISQENDTLTQIGTSTLKQLLCDNMKRFTPEQWTLIVDMVMRLFSASTPLQLFDPMLIAPPRSPPPDTSEAKQPPTTLFRRLEPVSELKEPLASTERRYAFQSVIMRCVLQLLLITMIQELLHQTDFLIFVPIAQLERLLQALQDSYAFAKRFDADRELRLTLWGLGFMSQLPNLLRQETTAAATIISIYVRMLQDDRPDRVAIRPAVRSNFVPLAQPIALHYAQLDAGVQDRHIASWLPVVTEIFLGIAKLEDSEPAPRSRDAMKEDVHTFSYHASNFYPTAIALLAKMELLSPELHMSLQAYFYQAGLASGLCTVTLPKIASSSVCPAPFSTLPELSQKSTFPTSHQFSTTEQVNDVAGKSSITQVRPSSPTSSQTSSPSVDLGSSTDQSFACTDPIPAVTITSADEQTASPASMGDLGVHSSGRAEDSNSDAQKGSVVHGDTTASVEPSPTVEVTGSIKEAADAGAPAEEVYVPTQASSSTQADDTQIAPHLDAVASKTEDAVSATKVAAIDVFAADTPSLPPANLDDQNDSPHQSGQAERHPSVAQMVAENEDLSSEPSVATDITPLAESSLPHDLFAEASPGPKTLTANNASSAAIQQVPRAVSGAHDVLAEPDGRKNDHVQPGGEGSIPERDHAVADISGESRNSDGKD